VFYLNSGGLAQQPPESRRKDRAAALPDKAGCQDSLQTDPPGRRQLKRSGAAPLPDGEPAAKKIPVPFESTGIEPQVD
jgi:hypothetical protein